MQRAYGPGREDQWARSSLRVQVIPYAFTQESYSSTVYARSMPPYYPMVTVG